MSYQFRTVSLVLCAAGLVVATPAAYAQFNSGSDGSDGSFWPQTSVLIDLSEAATASWNTPSPNPGKGVYDPVYWAVVFKYTTINIPSGVTVYFKNHPKGAPVVWLAQGDVTIDGMVYLSGATGSSGSSFAEPGPGGFAAGRESGPGFLSSGGFGPGGAPRGISYYGGGYGSIGGYASGAPGGWTYGNVSVLPLIGGSGASAGYAGSGGAGGGAILAASSKEIIVNGTVTAGGGSGGSPYGGGGSGGAIRLMANTVSGSGALSAPGGGSGSSGGGPGGVGRIRIEGHSITYSGTSGPPATYGTPEVVFPPSNAPTLRVKQIAGKAVPQDPEAGVLTPDVSIDDANPVTVMIEATYIPPGTTVEVRVVPEHGDVISATSTPLTGSVALSLATAQVQFPRARCEIQLKANWTP